MARTSTLSSSSRRASTPRAKYPVVVHWYGGPGLQMVSNRYGATNIFNHHRARRTLHAGGVPRVAAGQPRLLRPRTRIRDADLRSAWAAALDDQLAGIEYLRTLPYVDAARIGTDGKSFGGYMTLYALIYAPDVFAAAWPAPRPPTGATTTRSIPSATCAPRDQNPEAYAATNLIDKVDQIAGRAAADPRPGRHQRALAEHGELHRGAGGDRQAVRASSRCPTGATASTGTAWWPR